MEFETFLKEIKEGIEQKTGLKVNVREVLKNNGVLLHGLTLENGNAVRPTVYVEGLFEAYCNEEAGMEQIICKTMELLQSENGAAGIEVEGYNDFQKIRERVFFKLINYKKNQALLQTVPHMRVLDLAKVFVVDACKDNSGSATILVRMEHIKLWGIDLDELNRMAEENTERMFPATTLQMSKMLEKWAPETDGMEWLDDMFVVTNDRRLFGAAVLNYARFFKTFAENAGWKDLIILPSSVHELIVIPDNGKAKELEQLVREINRSTVDAEEVLSDSVYIYRFKEDCVEVA